MKKSIFLFFAALLCATSSWAWNISSGKVYYFKPSSDWKSSGARFAAAFGTNDDTWYWYSCQKVQGETDLYYVISNGDYDWMIFCRMNPSTSDNNWNNKWTEAVRVYPNNGYNRFDIKTDNSWSNDFNWYKYAPPMSSVTLSDNGTSIHGGNGTSSNPYLVTVGSTIKVKASGTKAVADPDAQIYYNFKQSTSSKQNKTNTTYEFVASTTAGTTYTINLEGYTKVNTTSSTTKTATALHFKTIAPTIKFAGDMTGWKDSAKDFTLNGTTATLDIHLTQAIHEFKIIETYNSNEIWLGNNGKMHRKNCTDWKFRNKKEDNANEDEENCSILVEVEGTYTFSWNILTQELSVTKTPEFDVSSQPDIIYFQPSERWTDGNARFAAYFCYGDKNTEEKWADLEDKDGDGVYEVANEKKHSVIIFVRMNPAHNTNKWENDYNWNQTADLFIPMDMDGNNWFKMTPKNDEWDNSGEWSPYVPTIQLVDGDNSETLEKYDGKKVNAQVNRTFVAKDGYYTICLPFDLAAEKIGKALQISSITENVAEQGMNVVFTEVVEGTLKAGQPYLVLPSENIEDPIFEGVTIVNTTGETTEPVSGAGINITFTGIINGSGTTNGSTEYYVGDKGWLYNGEVDKLGLRAFFTITDAAGQEVKNIRARVVTREDAATGFENITNGENTTIKLIENGQLIIIRNGEKFNAQGQKL
jgi:hypothetical protein